MRRHKRHQQQGFMAGAAMGLLLSLVSFFAWWYLPAFDQATAQAGSPLSHERKTPARPIHILVLGVDEMEDEVNRSDAMLLIRAAGDQVRVLSLPRDTLVSIDGYGEGKLNSAYTYGGPELAKQTVSELLSVTVDYHVTLDLSGFRHLVDLMGGVEYDVPKPMSYHDPASGLVIDLEPGLQRLDGDKAEQFVRFRSDEIGDDVSRIQRQQSFMKAAAAQAMTPANLTRLPSLVMTGARYLKTDIPLAEQIRLAHRAYGAQQRDAVLQETLPGHGDYVDGISFFLVNGPALDRLVANWQANESHP